MSEKNTERIITEKSENVLGETAEKIITETAGWFHGENSNKHSRNFVEKSLEELLEKFLKQFFWGISGIISS